MATSGSLGPPPPSPSPSASPRARSPDRPDSLSPLDVPPAYASVDHPDTFDHATASPTGSSGSHGSSDPSAHPSSSVASHAPPAAHIHRQPQLCPVCYKPIIGQLVRALGTAYHFDCFRCKDCGKVVKRFFPVDGPGQRQYPLCEQDYFRRLDLICAKCHGPLKDSYITALDMKFHVEHFTCSVCPTVFGPEDSYYEHDGQVYCHFHYSTRFAIKCTGCRTAILKQFVEMNRNNVDERWHPECYMIHKFWNIKMAPTGLTPKNMVTPPAQITASTSTEPSPEALEIEANDTPASLKLKQKQMEEQVYRIWTVLSAFEESSAACISEMLRHVSSGRYLDGVRMAEKFIFHVEILFSAIDDLEAQFLKEHAKGISHIREARMLCKKIVNFFSLLSHTQETGARRMGITQELLSLVTGLAHYLKILIRIALTGALKLEREYQNRTAIAWFLGKLAILAREGGNRPPPAGANQGVGGSGSQGFNPATYGYRSLPRDTSSSADGEQATDLCVSCGQTVEEECFRMGTNLRWHWNCLRCSNCRRSALRDGASSGSNGKASSSAGPAEDGASSSSPPGLSAAGFAFEVTTRPYDPASANGPSRHQHPQRIMLTYCPNCARPDAQRGFEPVTRLEQYSFLVRVALNRLYALLKKRGVVPPSPPLVPSTEAVSPTESNPSEDMPMYEAYRDSSDIKRMKSVNLDRKLSKTARLPQRSTVVESPSGKVAQQGESADRDVVRPTESQSAGTHTPRSPRSTSRDPSPGAPEPPPGALQPGRLSPAAASLPPTLEPRQRRGSAQAISSSPTDSDGPGVSIRPPFARANTDVRIVNDGAAGTSGADESKMEENDDEDGLTLADIPQLLEAEQAREQHRSLPSQGGGRAMSELSALELFIVKHVAVMALEQSQVKDLLPMDDLLDFIESRKNTFWGKLFKGGKDKKDIKKKGVFGIPLEILVERNGTDSLLGATATHLRVPCFVDDVILAMRQMDMSVEGIFRKNGNIRRLKELSEAIDREATVNFLEDNPVQLAALLKRFLRDLPDPLLTFKLHRLFIASQKLETEAERKRILHLVCVLLPKAHRDTMEVLFVFLKWVASFSHVDEETGSKMDLQNLATVICPNILYSKGKDPAKDESFLAIRTVHALLEGQDEFWTVPREFDDILSDRELFAGSADLTSREIMKKCEKYIRRKPVLGGSSGDARGELHNRHHPAFHHPHPSRINTAGARGHGQMWPSSSLSPVENGGGIERPNLVSNHSAPSFSNS